MPKRKQFTKTKKKKIINLILFILPPPKKKKVIRLFIKRNVRNYIISLPIQFK